MDDLTKSSSASLSNRLWIDPAPVDGDTTLRTLCKDLDVTPALARILAARGLSDPTEAHDFLYPRDTGLHPPQLMKGMTETVQRILRAVENYEKIIVFGDYDMDGTAGAVILYSYLKRLGARVQYFIPRRLAEGYGFTAVTLQKFQEWGADLVITTDFGSTEMEAPEILRRMGMDLIITDHHQLGAGIPDAHSMVNPQQPGCPYPFKDLSAAGVAFKVICAMDDHLEDVNFWNRHGLCHTAPGYYLDLVALATVADMSPLKGENRILVKLGLEMLNSNVKPGISGLVKECRVRGPITPHTITFKLAPKINALGRIGDPRLGMQLLLSHSFTEARRLARQLVKVNRERRAIERGVYEKAMELMDSMPERPAMILVGSHWHPGVIGSIATRIAYQIHRPTVVLTDQDPSELMGSVRSSRQLDVLSVLESCETLLDRFGGHRSAAGLSLQRVNLTAFTDHFQSAIERGNLMNGVEDEGLKIDAWIEPAELTPRFLEELGKFSPFGFGNPEPVIGLKGFKVNNPAVVNNRHLKFSLDCSDGVKMEAFAWDHSDWNVADSSRYDIAFMPQISNSNSGQCTRLSILDLKRAE